MSCSSWWAGPLFRCWWNTSDGVIINKQKKRWTKWKGILHIQRDTEAERERELYSCWLINNACFIQNQLGLSTQNMFCIMKSLATSLVQQQCYSRPKNPANYRHAEPSHNMKGWGVYYMGLQIWRAFLGHLWQDMSGFCSHSLKFS